MGGHARQLVVNDQGTVSRQPGIARDSQGFRNQASDQTQGQPLFNLG
jgi:hypothetical protein